MDRAVEHLGAERAGRYLRKFYPWYVERLDLAQEQDAQALQQAAPSSSASVLARCGASRC